MDWLPFLWSTLRFATKACYQFMRILLIPILLVLFWYYWPWSLIYLLSSASILGSFFAVFFTVQGSEKRLWLTFLFLIFWGFLVVAFLKKVWLLTIITGVLSIPLLLLYILLRSVPRLYIHFLRQDNFKHYYWIKYKNINWQKIFIQLQEKGFQDSLSDFPAVIFYRIPKKISTTTAFLHCTLDYWVAQSIPLEAGDEYPAKNSILFLKKLKLENYILLFLHSETLVPWLDYAHQKPVQYPLLEFIFKTFNDRLSAYIVSPYELNTVYIKNFNPDKIDAQTALLSSKVLDTEAPLTEAIALSQGLLLLTFAIHQELKGLQNEMVA